MRCDAMRCDAMRCDAMRCDAMRCDAMRCDAMRCGSVRVSGGTGHPDFVQTLVPTNEVPVHFRAMQQSSHQNPGVKLRGSTHCHTHSLTHSLTHFPTLSLTHSLSHSLTNSLTLSLSHSLTHSLTPFHFLSSKCRHVRHWFTALGIVLLLLLPLVRSSCERGWRDCTFAAGSSSACSVL
jgi:hypothetical protein